MVALIMVGLSFQNLPKIHPKPSQNAPKILPKPSLNPPKTFPEPFQNPPSKRNARKIDFFRFFSIFGGPGASQNRVKIAKNRKKIAKIKIKKPHVFLLPFVVDFSLFWPPKSKPKSKFFRYFFENIDFIKIVLPSRRNCYFSRFELPKND